MWQDVLGVVLVYNPDRQPQERDLEHWHHMFVAQQGLSSDHCLVIASCQPWGGAEITSQHERPTCEWSGWSTLTRLASGAASLVLTVSLCFSAKRFEGVKWVCVSLQENPEMLRGEFSSFVNHLITTSRDRQAHEEEGIVTNRS